ncbi:hypothetical protein [Streptomyces sp. NPDC046759]|uniref:hypothetical protein n=1 Tax=Streptomyces sp. NPDC046759 TaxID=3155019 RepID=UPI0033FC8301
MHRTTTTAALLATVAVSALSGCVTVQRPATPPAPTRGTAPPLPTAPRADGSAEPRVVQAPAQEALEMTGPSRRPKRAAPTVPRRRAEEPPVVHRPPAPPAAPPRAREHPRQSHTALPDLPQPVPRTPSDVCALGRKYGGWRTDSPESVICDQAYGR